MPLLGLPLGLSSCFQTSGAVEETRRALETLLLMNPPPHPALANLMFASCLGLLCVVNRRSIVDPRPTLQGMSELNQSDRLCQGRILHGFPHSCVVGFCPPLQTPTPSPPPAHCHTRDLKCQILLEMLSVEWLSLSMCAHKQFKSDFLKCTILDHVFCVEFIIFSYWDNLDRKQSWRCTGSEED